MDIIKIGQRYKHRDGGKYILAVFENLSGCTISKCGLINLKSGYFWVKPVIVENVDDITKDEFIGICGGLRDYNEFNLI
jgi:hypothetical protein